MNKDQRYFRTIVQSINEKIGVITWFVIVLRVTGQDDIEYARSRDKTYANLIVNLLNKNLESK
jgi:hypothetical protein